MDGHTHTVTIGGLTVVVLLAGCLLGGVVEDNHSPTPSPTQSLYNSENVCVDWVSFYGLSNPNLHRWDPDEVRIGYMIPPARLPASVLFVAYENNTVLGTKHVTTEGITVDGAVVALDDRLDGNHTVRVVTYSDTNDNGQFDPSIDTPCHRDGQVVQTTPRTINFSAIQNTPAPTTTDATTRPISPLATQVSSPPV